MAKELVVKTCRKGYKVSTARVKHLTLDSAKNQLKLVGKYTITLNEAI